MRTIFFTFFFFLLAGGFLKAQNFSDSLVGAYFVLGDYSSAVQLLDSKIKVQPKSGGDTLNSFLFQKGLIYQQSGQMDSALFCFNSVFLNEQKRKSAEFFFPSAQKLLELFYLKSDTVAVRNTINSVIKINGSDTTSLWHFLSVFWQFKLEPPSLKSLISLENLKESVARNGFVELQLEVNLKLAETAQRLRLNANSNRFLTESVVLADSLGNLEFQLKVRRAFLSLAKSMLDARKVALLNSELDSLQSIAEVNLKSDRLKAIEIIRKSAEVAYQKSIKQLLNQKMSEIRQIEEAGFTRRLFLLLLVFLFLLFFAFYFFRSMRLRKKLQDAEASNKKILQKNEELKTQIAEFVASSDELIHYNEQSERESSILKNQVKSLNELLIQSKQDTSGLLKRLSELQVVYEKSEISFKKLYPTASFLSRPLNGLNFYFFACTELRLLKPGKMFASKGDSVLSGVGEFSEIFILYGSAKNLSLDSALNNLWLQQIAMNVMADRKNRTIEMIVDSFKTQINQPDFSDLQFSLVKINRDNHSLEFSYHGKPLFIFNEQKSQKISQTIHSTILSKTALIGISTVGDETAEKILPELDISPNIDLNEKFKNYNELTGLWVKIPLV